MTGSRPTGAIFSDGVPDRAAGPDPERRPTMRRLTALATIAWVTVLGFAAPVAPAQAKTFGPNGQIAFFRNKADDHRPSHTPEATIPGCLRREGP